MINLFDLSAGMAGTKLLTDRAHRDGSPVRRNRADVKKTSDPAKIHVDDKEAASDRSSASNRSNKTPMKMLIANEMTKETESRRKPPSVVARLMGLEDDLPAQEPVLQSTRRDLNESYSHNNLTVTRRAVRQQEPRYSCKPVPRDIHISSNETVKYKDVYEVCEHSSRDSHFQDRLLQKGRFSENKSDKRMEVVRQKFLEAKRLATDEKLLHSKEFQEALEVLSSNRDLFLKFLEEPNSVFSKQLSGLHAIPPPSQTKRITVLKPVKSVESKGVRQVRRQLDESGWETRKAYQRSRSKDDIVPQPTRIVVLKPSPGKPNGTKAKLTPRATITELVDQNGYCGGLEGNEATLGSGEVCHTIQHMREGWHRRDESLLSSVYSNGYGGDESSFSRSEIDYIEEGGSFSDSEIASPASHHSWDYINRYGSPFSASTLSKATYSPESSVIREAKKRLSERWAMVAHTEVNQEEIQMPRSSSTLGEMLALPEVKKEEVANGGLSVSSSRSCVTENESSTQATCVTIGGKNDGEEESSPKNLSRSKSVPVSSSTFENIVLNAQASNSQDGKTTKDGKIPRSNQGKSFFKGKVSSFFFSRGKRPGKEKPGQLSASSDRSDEIPYAGDTRETNHDIVEDKKSAALEDKTENSSLPTLNSASKSVVSLEKPGSSDCPSGNEGPRTTRDQPSPTSVLDVQFEDINSNEPELSGSCRTNQQALSRFSAIESVARSLPWEDAHWEAPLLNTPKLPRTLSKVDDDEFERCLLVQKIISVSGLDNERSNMVFAGWYLPDCPLNPVLLDTFLDRKEEAAKSRERRSNQRLLFDCVNTALLEIGQNALVSAYLGGKAHAGAWRDNAPCPLTVEVWSLVRSWFSAQGKSLAGENENAGLVMERVVKREVEGRGWAESMRLELDEITREIEGGVLEELVGEAVADLAI